MRVSTETVQEFMPGSSKEFCLNPRDGVWSPLTSSMTRTLWKIQVGLHSLRGVFEDQPLENFVHLLCTSCWWSNFSGFRNPRNKHKRQLQVQNNQTKWQPSLGWSSFQGFFSTKRQGLVALPAIEGTSWPQWFSCPSRRCLVMKKSWQGPSQKEKLAYPQTRPPSKSVDFFGIRYNMIIFEELSNFKHLIP